MSITTKYWLWSLGHAFFGGGTQVLAVAVIAPNDVGHQLVKLFITASALGAISVWQWLANQKNPYEPDTVSLKRLPDDVKASVIQALEAAGLDSKGQPTK